MKDIESRNFHTILFRPMQWTIKDLSIAIRTRSLIVHCEYVLEELEDRYITACASLKTNGVNKLERTKKFISDHNWVVVKAPNTGGGAHLYDREHRKPYDIVGSILMSWRKRKMHRDSWFCSELAAHLSGLPRPHAYSPKSLYLWANSRKSLT